MNLPNSEIDSPNSLSWKALPDTRWPSRRTVSVIVPTYKESENLPRLTERLEKIRNEHQLSLELLIMDDNSQDGTEELVSSMGKDWVKLVVRKKNRGLSQAVLNGLTLARGDVFVVMDADLSHPPEKIPEMLDALENGRDFVIGSRYVTGGSTEASWGLLRWLNSRVATMLARPFTRAMDPMSGFFALPRKTFESACDLNPIGYKIGLELIVKCNVCRVKEIPIYFADRQFGQSKLTLTEQKKYIQHLRRLFIYKYPNWSCLIQFMAVGSSGALVNLAILTCLLAVHVPVRAAVALAIFVSMISNFALNRQFTFGFARDGSIYWQFVGFVASCSLGAVVNYVTTVRVLTFFPFVIIPQVAALFGIGAGTTVNFVTNRHIVFRKPSSSA